MMRSGSGREKGDVVSRWCLRISSLVAALVLGCSLALLDPRPAFACSCTAVSTQQAYDQADDVFLGTVTELQVTGSRGRLGEEIRFRVSRVYKGEVFAEQVVTSTRDANDCALSPQVGTTWLIFATATAAAPGEAVERLTTTRCSGNLPSAYVPRLFGTGQPPRPGASDTEEKAVRTDARLTRVLGYTGVGVAVVALLAAGGLSWLWRPSRR